MHLVLEGFEPPISDLGKGQRSDHWATGPTAEPVLPETAWTPDQAVKSTIYHGVYAVPCMTFKSFDGSPAKWNILLVYLGTKSGGLVPSKKDYIGIGLCFTC